jgi:hypothetical protein
MGHCQVVQRHIGGALSERPPLQLQGDLDMRAQLNVFFSHHTLSYVTAVRFTKKCSF